MPLCVLWIDKTNYLIPPQNYVKQSRCEGYFHERKGQSYNRTRKTRLRICDARKWQREQQSAAGRGSLSTNLLLHAVMIMHALLQRRERRMPRNSYIWSSECQWTGKNEKSEPEEDRGGEDFTKSGIKMCRYGRGTSEATPSLFTCLSTNPFGKWNNSDISQWMLHLHTRFSIFGKFHTKSIAL